MDIVHDVDTLTINLATANDKWGTVVPRIHVVDCELQTRLDNHPVRPITRVGRDDDIRPVRQRLADRFKTSPSHNYMVALGKFLEPDQIRLQVPGHLAVFPDNVVIGNRHYYTILAHIFSTFTPVFLRNCIPFEPLSYLFTYITYFIPAA